VSAGREYLIDRIDRNGPVRGHFASGRPGFCEHIDNLEDHGVLDNGID
jgi:hypothetical protein